MPGDVAVQTLSPGQRSRATPPAPVARRGRVGIRLSTHDPPTVLAVLPGSAADRAGLRPGDALAPADRALIARCCAGRSIVLAGVDVTPDPWPAESYPDLDVAYGEVSRGGLALRTVRVAPPGRARAAVLYAQGHDLGSIERGTLGDDDPLRGLVLRLARAGFAVHRVERRGVGDSEGGDPRETSWTDERDDLAAALAALDDGPVALLGHSLGAAHAAALAARDPRVRALALYGAGADPWRAYLDANLRRQLARAGRADESIALRARDFHDAVLGRGEDPLAAAAGMPEAVRRLVGLDPEGRLHGRAAAYWRGVDAEDLAAPLRALRVPSRTLWGDEDPVTTRDEGARVATLARGELAVVAGADHGFATDGRWQPRVGDALLDGLSRALGQ